MFALPLLLQLATAVPLPPRDSAALHDRVKDAGFWFVMRWRWQLQFDQRFPSVIDSAGTERIVRPVVRAGELSRRVAAVFPPDTAGGWIPRSQFGPRENAGAAAGRCDYERAIASDVDQHTDLAHLIKGPRRDLSFCPVWGFFPPMARDPALLDRALTREGMDSVRALRRNYLRLLDSAARKLPGDGLIAGQRVRLNLDQNAVAAATRAAQDCRAQAWWCAALQGYVRYQAGDNTGANERYAHAHALMPLSVRCEWDDLAPLLTFSERQAYTAMPCARRDSINRVAWWLADPLFIQAGNDRHTEQMVRHTIIALHGSLGVDLWQDWRDNYQGPQMRETILRFGRPVWFSLNAYSWPGEDFERRAAADPHSVLWQDPKDSIYRSFDDLRIQHQQPPFSRGDTRATFLGVRGNVVYAGPQFHTLPSLRAMLDPMNARPSDWDLAPGRAAPDTVGGLASPTAWDGSWWATEFYHHSQGPLVPVESQVGFIRRAKNPVLTAAVAWDTVGYAFPPPRNNVMLAAVTMRGPDAPRLGGTETIAAGAPLSIAAVVEQGRSVLGVEIAPAGEPGTTGRTRMGIDAPGPLSALRPGEIALSDPILVHASPGDKPPVDAEAMLGRMLGTTTLRDPSVLGLFWEAYGLADRDTVDVAVRIVRRSDATGLQRLGASLGVGRVGDDTLTITWKEPRPDDPAATTEAGVTIRPRGLVLNVSALAAGSYAVDISVTRGAVTARSRRELTITRR